MNGCYWIETAPPTRFPRLEGELEVDVAIVGGGIVGISTARLLKDAGLTVAVLEARRVGQEVTGKSTAKITSQHHLAYQTLERKFGEEGARTYAAANEAAVGRIVALAEQHGIAADIERKPAFVFTRAPEHVEEIEKEAEVARRLGLPASLTRETGLPFGVLAAIRYDGQAQFHPCKYVAGLAKTILGGGCHVFEESRVTDWDPTRVAIAHGQVRARRVVMATHMPLGQIGPFYAEAYPHMHPVMAAKADPARAPEGMFISAETPRHSIRTHRVENGDTFLIFAGATFKHGDGDEQRQSFADLERFAREQFGIEEVGYRWTNEDYAPMDGLPFIGWSSSFGEAYLVATGFNAWGISNGMVAAQVLTGLIQGRDSPEAKLFDARRVKPVAGGKQFVTGNAEVAKNLVGGYLAERPSSYEELKPGQGAVLEIGGKKVAAFRDEAGQIHTVSAACTHMGCIVGWNETDRSWDCPCHGSRFEAGGEVIHGPAVKPLAPHPLSVAEDH